MRGTTTGLNRGALLALALACITGSAGAVTIEVGSASVEAGATVEVMVSLRAGSQDVAATQNDLVWDEAALSLSRGACRINPGIGAGSEPDKSLSSHMRASNVMRAIVISIGNSNPIPSGALYSCAFQVRPDAPAGPTVIQATALGVSDPKGNPLGATAANGTIYVSGQGGGSGTGARSRPGPAAAPRAIAPAAPAPAPAAGIPGAPALPSGQEAAPAAGIPGAPALPRARDVAPAEVLEQAPGEAVQAVEEALGAGGTPTAPAAPVRTPTKRAATPAADTPTPKQTAAQTPAGSPTAGTPAATPAAAATPTAKAKP